MAHEPVLAISAVRNMALLFGKRRESARTGRFVVVVVVVSLCSAIKRNSNAGSPATRSAEKY